MLASVIPSHNLLNLSLIFCIFYKQELTEFPIMAIRAEKEIKRYIPPRTGTLTLVVVDGFTLKVLSFSILFLYAMRVAPVFPKCLVPSIHLYSQLLLSPWVALDLLYSYAKFYFSNRTRTVYCLRVIVTSSMKSPGRVATCWPWPPMVYRATKCDSTKVWYCTIYFGFKCNVLYPLSQKQLNSSNSLLFIHFSYF